MIVENILPIIFELKAAVAALPPFGAIEKASSPAIMIIGAADFKLLFICPRMILDNREAVTGRQISQGRNVSSSCRVQICNHPEERFNYNNPGV